MNEKILGHPDEIEISSGRIYIKKLSTFCFWCKDNPKFDKQKSQSVRNRTSFASYCYN